MDDSDIIVDAIFGTGFKGSLSDDMRNIIAYINSNKDNKKNNYTKRRKRKNFYFLL